VIVPQNRIVHRTLCANDNETKYPVKFRLRAT
jgi:hypothetical protein